MATWAPSADLDPQYGAIIAALESQQQQVTASDVLRRKQMQDDYDYALAQAQSQRPAAEKRLFGSHLQRGVAQSGGAARQRAEQAAGFVQQDDNLAVRLQAGTRSADADLQTRLADLQVRRASEEGASRGRVAQREQELTDRWITAGGGYQPGSILGGANVAQPAAAAPAPVYSTVPGYEGVLQSDIDKWVAAGGAGPATAQTSAPAPRVAAAPSRPAAPRPAPAPARPTPPRPPAPVRPIARGTGATGRF